MTAPRPPMAFRPDDLARRPRITAADVHALIGLIAFAAIIVALCAVAPDQIAATR